MSNHDSGQSPTTRRNEKSGNLWKDIVKQIGFQYNNTKKVLLFLIFRKPAGRRLYMSKKQKEQKDFIMMPKVDFCFKELMTDEDVRKGFLSALLNLKPEEITTTTLLPTHLKKEHENDKLGILDVKVLLNNGITIDIEIQIAIFPFWQERSLFYLCKIFAEQLQEGDRYQKLEKCIHVGILDYVLFPEDTEYYSKFHLKEDKRDLIYSDKLEIHILELPKLAQHPYPQDALLNWAKFFYAEQKGELENLSKTDPYIKKAYNKLLHISEDEQKRIEYEERQKAIRDYNHLIYCSREEGFAEGISQGISQGISRGITQGIAQETEHGIQILIEMCMEMSISEDDTLQKLMQKYSLSKESATDYLHKYRDNNQPIHGIPD